MSANIADKLTNVSNGTRPVSTTVQTLRSAGVTTLACADLTGWATDTAVHFVTYKVNGQGAIVAGSQTDWKGIVSGNTITNLTVTGGTDAGNANGDIVEILPTARWAKELTDALRVTLNQDGTLQTGIVTSTKLATNAVTTAAITDANVTTAKLVDGSVTATKIAYNTVPAFRAYLNVAQTSANNTVVKVDTVDFDNSSAFNTTTWRFVAPVTAIYHFSWNIQSATGSSLLSGIAKNGTVVARGAWLNGSTFIGSSGASDISLTAGDYVQLYCVNLAGTPTVDNGAANTYLSGHLVAKL